MRIDSGQEITGRHFFKASQTGTLLNATGSLGGLELYSSGASAAAFMSFHRPGAFAGYFGLDTDNQFAVGGWSAFSTTPTGLAYMKVGALGVGVAGVANGNIHAAGDITAFYSDARLKTDIKKIDDALSKVNSISGITYVNNKLAESFGYESKDRMAGVLAQEVEAVLPEVVTLAPFDIAKDSDGNVVSKSGENYKTVKYDKIVPLLIEAIKELSEKVDSLQNELAELKK